MLSLASMVGVSAVLSLTLVTGYNALALDQPASKPFQQRLAAEDTEPRVTQAGAVLIKNVAVTERSKACEGQAWPYYDQGCLKAHRAEVPSSPVRWITVESRSEPATSTLTRAPQMLMAER